MVSGYKLRLVPAAELRWLLEGGRPGDGSWSSQYPMDGDQRAAGGYLDRLSGTGQSSDIFGYYQVVLDSVVIGGAGFHGPPILGVVEVGYGIVPAARGRGAACAALLGLIQIARSAGVELVTGNADAANLPSQAVMSKAGMQSDGLNLDPAGDLMAHFSIDLREGSWLPSARSAES